MRVLLFTGKGGVGKTTAAAGTATLAAHRGRKTLVLSTDPAHSLADAFDHPVGGEPIEVDAGLFVQQVDAQRRFERSWRDIQGYLMSALDAAGVDAIEAEELAVFPGAEEIFALFELRDQVRSGSWDLVVVDCAPTAETLRLLALPEALRWYMQRVFPDHGVLRSLRSVLGRVAGVPMPDDRVFDAVSRLHAELVEVRRVLTEPDTSVRLVLTPESVVVAEARRTLTSLSLYGYRVDGVLANRVFPNTAGADLWRAGWVAAQAEQLAEVEASFAPIPVHRSPYRAAEPVGLEELAAFAAEAYSGVPDPFAPPPAEEPLSVERAGDEFLLSLGLPFADRREIDLARSGDELVLTVGGRRRILALPSALRRCSVAGAALGDGRLSVRFTPDPELWMSR
jgi:arsenite-transporting ATPase